MRLRTLPALAATAATGLALSLAGPTTAFAGSSNGGLNYLVKPVQLKTAISPSQAAALPSPSACIASYGIACNNVDSIRSAYDIPSTIKGQPAGTGQTIAIVDAFGSPTVQSDLDQFSRTMGIPSTQVNISYPTGNVAWHGTTMQDDWAGETELDVEWAHAVAPGAKIDLVVASNSSGDVMNNAIKYANSLNPDTLSMSFASFEGDVNGQNGNNVQYRQAQKILGDAAAQGTSLFAASGDWGSDNGEGFSQFNFPASDNNVTAVGGTTLYKNVDPSQPPETVWDDYTGCPFGCTQGTFGATGGSPSLLTSKRGSDVAYDASVYTSVLVYESFDPSSVASTSSAARRRAPHSGRASPPTSTRPRGTGSGTSAARWPAGPPRVGSTT